MSRPATEREVGVLGSVGVYSPEFGQPAPGGDRLVVVPPIVYTDADTVQVTVLGEESALSGLVDRFPDGADVAAALDCSEAAASTLLRSAEAHLVNAALGT